MNSAAGFMRQMLAGGRCGGTSPSTSERLMTCDISLRTMTYRLYGRRMSGRLLVSRASIGGGGDANGSGCRSPA